MKKQRASSQACNWNTHKRQTLLNIQFLHPHIVWCEITNQCGTWIWYNCTGPTSSTQHHLTDTYLTSANNLLSDCSTLPTISIIPLYVYKSIKFLFIDCLCCYNMNLCRYVHEGFFQNKHFGSGNYFEYTTGTWQKLCTTKSLLLSVELCGLCF